MEDPFESSWQDPESSPALSSYPASLPHDVACCVSSEELEAVRIKYSYSPEDWDYVINRHDFKKEYTEWYRQLISEGNTFKLKLRAMAESFLPSLHHLLASETVAPSVKVDAFKYITKVAGLEPEKADPTSQSSSTQTTRFVVQWEGSGTGQAALEVKNG